MRDFTEIWQLQDTIITAVNFRFLEIMKEKAQMVLF